MILLKTPLSRLDYCIKREEKLNEERASTILVFNVYKLFQKQRRFLWYQHLGNNISQFCDEPLMCRGGGTSVLFLLSVQNRLWPFHPSNADSVSTTYLHNSLSTPFCHGPPHGTGPCFIPSLLSSAPQNQGLTASSHPFIPLPVHLPWDPCPMFPSSPVSKPKCRSWHERWESRLGYHHWQKKVTTCHRICLNCCLHDQGIIQGRIFIMWSDENLHIGRAGTFQLFHWLKYLNGLFQSVAHTTNKDCRDITSQVRSHRFLPA